MQGEDTDPLTVVVNLFDVSMVFAVSLMVAMVMNMNMTEVFTQEDFSVVKNPGKENKSTMSPRTPYLLSQSSSLYPHICRRPSSY